MNSKPRAALIDVHAHFVTDGYLARARAAGIEQPDGMGQWPSWNVETHLRLMDTWGVQTSVLSISSPGVHFGTDGEARSLARETNEYGAGIARAHPRRFGHFASLPLPDVDGALEAAGYALEELESDGLAIETNADGMYPGNERLEPLWSDLNRRKAIVFVHPTSPRCWQAVSLGRPRPMLEFPFDSTRAVSDLVLSGVLSRYPDIRWIFTHSGGALPVLADRIELFRTTFLDANVAGPTAPEQIARLWFDMAGTPFPNDVPAFIEIFGSQRLLYGSDYCFTPAQGVTAQLRAIDDANPPGDGSWRELTTNNARRLLPGLVD